MGVITRKVGLYEYACTLFDSSVSCSFVLTIFARLSKLAMKPLSESLNVALQMDKVVVCSKVATECHLVVRRHVIKSDLVIFKLIEFDIILGMECLS